jgi:hypothetical protein
LTFHPHGGFRVADVTDRQTTPPPSDSTGVTAIVLATLTVCCGLPVVVSLAAGVTIAGLGGRIWAVTVAAVTAIVTAAVYVARCRAPKEKGAGQQPEGRSDAHLDRTR